LHDITWTFWKLIFTEEHHPKEESNSEIAMGNPQEQISTNIPASEMKFGNSLKTTPNPIINSMFPKDATNPN